MSGILGKKLGMTRLLQDDGRVIPVTVVHCEPNEVAQIKTVEKDGYPAIVLGFSKLKKPSKTKKFYHLREIKVDESELGNYQLGQSVSVETMKDVEKVTVVAISKGKGYQGVMKKYNFHGGRKSHGSHFKREPGSVGACAKPGRVHKGKKLPGHMGTDQVTLHKVPVGMINTEKNIICIKGAVPGPNGGLVIIKK
ncbi:MAG: 50S ribosomal protein L3 [Candidatus Gracilibacteria bacterium]|nr:50S ribosomal protein L3 [Candidatus Gracilibacteria bacterium]